jgi:branched-chain amino acid transport system ATP-binding protein
VPARPTPPAPAPPHPNGAAANPAPGALSIDDLVARARAISAASVSPRDTAPRGGPKSPPAPAVAPLSMPALGDSRDRLRAALREIEEAAARARDWRPTPKP